MWLTITELFYRLHEILFPELALFKIKACAYKINNS